MQSEYLNNMCLYCQNHFQNLILWDCEDEQDYLEPSVGLPSV